MKTTKNLLTAIAICLLYTASLTAVDFNYAEVQGNVTEIKETHLLNVNTGSDTIDKIDLKIWTVDRGSEVLPVDCPTAPSALRDLCLNTGALLSGYCTMTTTTTTCTAGPTGDCYYYKTYKCGTGQVGKCVQGWGFMRIRDKALEFTLDALFTKQQSYCSTK